MGIRLCDRSATAGRLVGSISAKARSPRYFAAALLAVLVTGALVPQSMANKYVMLDYNVTMDSRARDAVFLELFDDKPLTVANFLQYVNNTSVNHGSYNGSLMHRLVPGVVMQGGGYYPKGIQEATRVALDPTALIDLDGNTQTSNATIANEANVGQFRSNTAGTVSMVLPAGPASASNAWSVNLGNNSAALDGTSNGGPYTVFGQVLADGMTLFGAFNTLYFADLNRDVNGDGFPDAGPFGVYNAQQQLIGGVPYIPGAASDILVVIEKATQIDYLGNGLTTNVQANGITFSTRDVFIDSGTAFTGTGAITVGAGRRLGIREGYSLNRNLVNHGVVAPGLQLGTATVQGNYFQFFDGTLEIQIAGTTADTKYDQLVVTGQAFLSGQLNVSFITGFTPAVGNSFTVLTASSFVTDFQVFNLPQLTLGNVWNISKNSTSYVLSVAAADFNRNGVVDQADYVLWRHTRNTTVTAYSGADGNGDGFINDADFAIWRSNFGNKRGNVASGSGSLVSGSVPEPAAAALVALAFCGLIGTRRKRAA